MTEETNKPISKLAGVGVVAATVVGGLWGLSAIGFYGMLAVGVMGVAAVGVYAATTEKPAETFTSVFKKVGSFFTAAFSSAKAGAVEAAEWAEKHEAERGGQAPVSEKQSQADFAEAAMKADHAQKVAAKPAPAPAPTRKIG